MSTHVYSHVYSYVHFLTQIQAVDSGDLEVFDGGNELMLNEELVPAIDEVTNVIL
jgi:hypothetical protein